MLDAYGAMFLQIGFFSFFLTGDTIRFIFGNLLLSDFLETQKLMYFSKMGLELVKCA